MAPTEGVRFGAGSRYARALAWAALARLSVEHVFAFPKSRYGSRSGELRGPALV